MPAQSSRRSRLAWLAGANPASSAVETSMTRAIRRGQGRSWRRRWVMCDQRARAPGSSERLSGGERRQLEDEAAARSVADDDVPAARPRQATREGQAEAGAVRFAGPADAGVERALPQNGIEPRAVVADRQADPPGVAR